MKKLLLLASLFAALFTACSTDIDINADWKDTTLVLGLLNTDHQTHFIRIHKAFLDEERGAFEVAQIQDSLYYKNLVVKIERIRGNAVLETYTCVQIDTAILEPGIFASPELILYRFSTDSVLDINSTYRLKHLLIRLLPLSSTPLAFLETCQTDCLLIPLHHQIMQASIGAARYLACF
jgi:hypothetical protein